MNTKLPWILVLAAIVALGAVYLSGQTKETELIKLREENQQLKAAQTQAEEAGKAREQNQADELARLRKDNEDLLRLRNEVRQLRDEKQQLSKQAETALAQAQSAQSQAQAARAQAEYAAQLASATAASAKQQTIACINNLRQIDAAKQQWALENGKAADAVPTWQDLFPYFSMTTTNGPTSVRLPSCPARGTYTINAVGTPPTCSIPGHVLQ